MQFYILKDGKQIGPMEKEQLPNYGLKPNSQVWAQGMPQWMPAWQVPELQPILASLPSDNIGGNTDNSSSMGFVDAIKVCFKKYVDFNGRARRSEYWWWTLFTVLVCIVTCGIGSIALILPSIAVTVRRLHDTGKSGWFYLLTLIPYIGSIIILIFTLQDSTDDNEYGPNPKG